MKKYDVIVIGAGHAGIEAAWSAARMGVSVLLLTLDIESVGKLSCNPAIGGVAKGHLVREVDALGGLIARIADSCAVSYRILNKSKGKAVWATRAQIDRFCYPKVARGFLESQGNIHLFQAKVTDIVVKRGIVQGVEVNFNHLFYGKTVIVCAGTFLKSRIHIGMDHFPGGRLNEFSSDKLFNALRKLGIKMKHFKTGTCARLDKRTIDFSQLIEQPPDKECIPFSFRSHAVPQDQMSCFITFTNQKTHRIIQRNLKHSPLYTGKIKSRGVRYCPSLEDKIVKFRDHSQHHIFLEPEGRDSIEMYPNGISTSLPFSVQTKFIASIAGFENVRIIKPGYGIEHGVIESRLLFPSLELKFINGLFFAGQVNGTTGYEEAAAQGSIAGINAALKVKKQPPFLLPRTQAYCGVLIDDLTLKGTDEPYRMFTSRCENRLILRESNAFLRLAGQAYRYGLLSKEELNIALEKEQKINAMKQEFKKIFIVKAGGKSTLYEYFKRPEVTFSEIKNCFTDREKIDALSQDEQLEVEIQIKYEGFIRREARWNNEFENLHKIRIPKDLLYSHIPSLSKEIVEKLQKYQPATLAAALQLSGVTPTAIFFIYNAIRQKNIRKKRP